MSSNVEEEEDNCPICLNPLTTGAVLRTECGHLFHTGCIAKITKEECPMCRTFLAVAEVIKNDNDVINEIRHDSEEEREEERRLINLALAIINRDNTVTHKKLTGMLIAAKGRPDFSIDILLSMFDDDRPAARIRALSPAASGNVSPAARSVARTVTKRVPKRDPKDARNAAIRFRKTYNKNKSGGKTKKKGQRTHRRKKNTSRSLYTIK